MVITIIFLKLFLSYVLIDLLASNYLNTNLNKKLKEQLQLYANKSSLNYLIDKFASKVLFFK